VEAYLSNPDKLAIECGSYRRAGEVTYINGLATMSAAGINGRKYEVALSSSEAATKVAEKASEKGSRSTDSTRVGSSSETFAENRNSSSMGMTKTDETRRGTKANRDSKSSVSASPRPGS